MFYESALGTALSLQMRPESRRILPAEHAFFLLLTEQVAAGDVKNGKYRLPAERDLSRLVDWQAVKRLAL